MPIYEYSCQDCGERFDQLQKMEAAPPPACPSCKASGKLVRSLSAPAIRLAGTGWYETDFKSKGEPRRNLAQPLPATRAEGGHGE